MLSEHSRLRVSPDVHSRTFDGELVLLNLTKGTYFGLKDVGIRFWEGVSKEASVAEIAGELVTEYDVELAVLQRDLLALGEALIREGLVFEVRV